MSCKVFLNEFSDFSYICFAGTKIRYAKTHDRNTMLQTRNT